MQFTISQYKYLTFKTVDMYIFIMAYAPRNIHSSWPKGNSIYGQTMSTVTDLHLSYSKQKMQKSK